MLWTSLNQTMQLLATWLVNICMFCKTFIATRIGTKLILQVITVIWVTYFMIHFFFSCKEREDEVILIFLSCIHFYQEFLGKLCVKCQVPVKIHVKIAGLYACRCMLNLLGGVAPRQVSWLLLYSACTIQVSLVWAIKGIKSLHISLYLTDRLFLAYLILHCYPLPR